jgi:uncharacterized repeat protein (TIGR01451 family)
MKWQVWFLAAIAAIALFGGQVGIAHATDPTTGDPVIAAVGDMACAPEDSSFNGGAGGPSNCGEIRTSAQMENDHTIDMLLGLGDYQYGCSDPAEWALSYNPSWGFFNNIIDPATGNHEYNTLTNSATGATCTDTNNAGQDYFNYFGAPAHQSTAGHYSFNVGSWHLISLNAQCNSTGVGGCGASSPQTQWLAADLAANSQPCIMAYWHQPRWTATSSNNSTYAAWWNLLYSSHADVVLGGHIHTYARFAQLNPSGAVDANGIREVIVGTGGESLQSASASANPKPLSNFRLFGYLRMVLHPTGYDAQFVISTGVVKDTFSGTCHGSSAPPAALKISQTSNDAVQADSGATYNVTIQNPSTTPQTNVTLTDNAPANAQGVTVSPSSGNCTGSGSGPYTCNVGTLAPGASATVTVNATPILPPTAVNAAAAQSDQVSQVTNSKVVTVTGAPNTSYVAVTNVGFVAPSPGVKVGNTVQWSFIGPGSHSATDKTTGLGLFPDTGLITPVAFRQAMFSAAGDYTFTDTATSNTIKLNVAMQAAPTTGSTSTPFTLTWATAAPPANYAEDVQVEYPGTSTWVSLFKATTATSGTFVPNKGTGSYHFRARFHSTTNSGASAYTTNATITVS